MNVIKIVVSKLRDVETMLLNITTQVFMDLAKHQARTNCGLSGQIAKVEYMGKEWDGRIMIDFKGSCTAEPGKANEDCKVKSCN